MRGWPWITIVLTIIFILSPPGQSLFHGAFVSNEALSRNIAQPILMICGAIVLLVALVEWLAWRWLMRRKALHKSAG